MSEDIKLASIVLPCCPFLCIYDGIIYPILEKSKIYITELTSFISSNDKIIKMFDLLKNYNIDCYSITQNICLPIDTDKIIQINVAFHTAYFKLFNPELTNITYQKFNDKIFMGIFTNDDNITEYSDELNKGISINDITFGDISFHNTKFSPKYSMLFKLNTETAKLSTEFISIMGCPTKNRIIMTKHIIKYI